MGKGKFFAGLLLVLIAAGVAVYFGPTARTETVHILYGSEKDGLIKDADFQDILKDEYGIVVEGTKMGSLEMADADPGAVDGVWPSSGLAARVFTSRHPGMAAKSQNIFNTPIVFYSWPEVTEALIREKIVEKRNNLYYVINTRKFLDMIVSGRTWKSMGLEHQNGLVSIIATDPTRSNSGFLTAGLIAVILNDGNMPDPATAGAHLETIQKIFRNMGFLENSTGYLFDKYLNQGQGAFPVIAAYENLLIEFYRAYPRHQDLIRTRTRVLIPEPTVWSEHPFLALSEKGKTLLNALQDPEIQKLAWDRYGFRSGVLGIENDPGILNEVGLPERVASVTPLPSPDVMEKISAALP